MRVQIKQTSEQNDSDTSSLSSVSFSQAPAHPMVSKKQQLHKRTIGNVNAQLEKSKCFPSTNRTPINTRAAAAEIAATANAPGQPEVTLHMGTTHSAMSQASPNRTGGPSETTTESVFGTAPIFTQPVHDLKKMGSVDPSHPKQSKISSK